MKIFRKLIRGVRDDRPATYLVVVQGVVGGEDDVAVADGEGEAGLGLGVDPHRARRRRGAAVVVGGRRRVALAVAAEEVVHHVDLLLDWQ